MAIERTMTRQYILDYIRAFWKEYRYAPTVSEIRSGLGLGSRQLVSYHVRLLKQEGKIEWDGKGSRSIKPKEIVNFCDDCFWLDCFEYESMLASAGAIE